MSIEGWVRGAVTGLTLMALSVGAAAQAPATPAIAVELANIYGPAQLTQSSRATAEGLWPYIANQIPAAADEALRAELEQLFVTTLTDAMTGILLPAMEALVPQLAALIAEFLSPEEMVAVVGFYHSPAGAKWVDLFGAWTRTVIGMSVAIDANIDGVAADGIRRVNAVLRGRGLGQIPLAAEAGALVNMPPDTVLTGAALSARQLLAGLPGFGDLVGPLTNTLADTLWLDVGLRIPREADAGLREELRKTFFAAAAEMIGGIAAPFFDAMAAEIAAAMSPPEMQEIDAFYRTAAGDRWFVQTQELNGTVGNIVMEAMRPYQGQFAAAIDGLLDEINARLLARDLPALQAR